MHCKPFRFFTVMLVRLVGGSIANFTGLLTLRSVTTFTGARGPGPIGVMLTGWDGIRPTAYWIATKTQT